jgi:hypothetical protein
VLFLRFATLPKRRKGRYAKNQNTIRDLIIVETITALEREGFRPTRNRAARHSNHKQLSGCAIVAEALAQTGTHIDETGVETIWSRRQSIRPKSS